MGERAAGYGLVRFNTETREITFECWPRGVDGTADDAEQYAGWPVTVEQRQSYGREGMAHLPEIRVDGTRFRPKVLEDGVYTVKMGEQPDRMKTRTGLDAQEDGGEREPVAQLRLRIRRPEPVARLRGRGSRSKAMPA